MPFAKFKARPVEIEAVKFVRANYPTFCELPGVRCALAGNRDEDNYFEVTTPHGVATGYHGDWLCRDSMGKLYPCKNEVFEFKYFADLTQEEINARTNEPQS